MKTFRILFVTILSLVLIQRVTAAVTTPAQETSPVVSRADAKGNMIKAVLHNGDYIPLVDLPLIEIVSTKPGSALLGTISAKGNYLVEIDLPEIEISATQTGATKYRSFIKNGETIVISNLPLVEIGASFPYNNLTSAIIKDFSTMPVVNLPEITISSSHFDNFLVSANVKNGVVIPYIDLPVIEIKPAYSWLAATQANEFAFSNKETEWIYISLQNCGITFENKILCEVSSTIKNSNITISSLKRLIN